MRNRLLLLLFLPTLTYAQFGNLKMVAGHSNVFNMEIADIDGDGDQDLIGSTYYSNDTGKPYFNNGSVFWFENEGNGEFRKQNVIGINYQTAYGQVAIADLNQDERPDLVTYRIDVFALDERPALIWYENLGNGLFSDEKIIDSVDPYVFSLNVGDLDGDGLVDIVTGDDSRLLWYKNEGNGNFLGPNLIGLDPNEITYLRLADIDQDGIQDIITGAIVGSEQNPPEIKWYKNHGNGNFNVPEIIPVGAEFIDGLRTTDLDQDGDIDIIAIKSGQLFWYENIIENGSFSTGAKISDLAIGTTDFATRDFDNDGDIDIICHRNTGYPGELSLLINLGNLNFNKLVITNELSRAGQVFTDDLDGDSDIDLVSFANINPSNISTPVYGLNWYKNDGNGIFSDETGITVFSEKFTKLDAGDLDQDGDVDLVSTAWGGNKVSWHESDGHGNFISQQIVDLDRTGRPWDIQIVDLDDDSKTDILCSFIDNTPRIQWYKNEGNGNFSNPLLIADANTASRQFVAKDLDGDALPEVIIYSLDGQVAWYHNEGNGIFSNSPQIILPPPSAVNYVFAGDLDLDGDNDIITASNNLKTLSWIENNGAGDFLNNFTITGNLFSTIEGIDIADLNGDGHKDIGVLTNGKIETYINDGFQNFTLQFEFAVSTGRGFGIIDLDGDGDNDLIFSGGSDLSWFANDGFGNFIKNKISESIDISSSWDLAVINMDEDADMDLVVADLTRSRIMWYENQIDHPTISGTIFWDKNEDASFNSGDQPLQGLKTHLSPQSGSSFTDGNGSFNYLVTNGNYILSVEPNECWELTTSSPNYQITIANNAATGQNFGYKLVSSTSHSQPRIHPFAARCNRIVPIWVSVTNDGCAPVQGEFSITLDPGTTLVSASREPIDINGNIYSWNYEELIASEVDQIKLLVQIPDFTYTGDILHFSAESYIENGTGDLQLSGTYNFSNVVGCSYDPNDKAVYPDRSIQSDYDKNYTLFNETLEYTIRFQNTGNDTAFLVVIRDTLDQNLDWNTFTPIAASHPFQTLLDDNGAVKFTFDDILLPDSTTNEPLSHGFITYQIKAQNGLPEFSDITNTAGIFFDQNPAVVTNTVNSVMVSDLSLITSTQELLPGVKLKVFPNPFNDLIQFGILSDQDLHNPFQVYFFDAKGRRVGKFQLSDNRRQTFSTAHLSKGLYFYQLLNSKGQLLHAGKMVRQ